MKLLNVGCGERIHKDWVNLDFISTAEGVIAHNLLKGIPFADATFDVVYHSHVLEHFTKADGEKLIGECFRVLKPGGIIRIAVPNLEVIANNYVSFLNAAVSGEEHAQQKYDWTMMELYDQTVRQHGGGEMGAFIVQDVVPNEDFVRSRIGYFYDVIRSQRTPSVPTSFVGKLKQAIKKVPFIKNSVVGIKSAVKKLFPRYYLGTFRLSGEVHLWMYDRLSLGRLLHNQGFKNPTVEMAATSHIKNWTSYNLDTQADGQVYKPDSLFMEAVK